MGFFLPKILPITGMNTSATIKDEPNTAIKVIGIYCINCPTIPGQNNKGAKAANVVAVEAVIGHAIVFAALR